MTVYPDTNVVLRYLLGDIPSQSKRASALFDEVLTGSTKAVILESVIVECVYVLTKYFCVTRFETAEKLSAILNYRGIINQDRVQLVQALKLYADSSIDIVDCILLIKAEGSDKCLFSFDERLITMQKKRK